MTPDALPPAAATAAELARLRDLGGSATQSEVAQFVAAECRMAEYALTEALEELDRGKRLTATMYLRLLAEYALRLSWLCGDDEVADELGRLRAEPTLVSARVRELRHRDLDQLSRAFDAIHRDEANATLGGELRDMASELGEVLAPGQIAQLGTTRFGKSLYRAHRTASTNIHAGAVLSSGPDVRRLPLEAMLAEVGFMCAALVDASLRAAGLDTGAPFPRTTPDPGQLDSGVSGTGQRRPPEAIRGGKSGVSIEQRVRELGLELPAVPTPAANYANVVRAGNLVFTSGTVPTTADGEIPKGKVGGDVTTEEAAQHARSVGLNLLAMLKHELGDLDRVRRVVKLLGMVNAVPDYVEHSRVVNGCSDLFEEVFGEQHARSAVGVGSLPFGITVEIEAIFEVG